MTQSGHVTFLRTRRFCPMTAFGACVCVAILAACQSNARPSASADTTLARDLARVNADSAGQPQLSDTAASPAPMTPARQPAARVRRTPVASHRPQSPAHVQAQTVAAAAPAPAATPAPPPPPLVAASGAAFDVLVADTVTTAKAHVGDPVTATVAADVKDASGAVVIPAGSTVHGAVTTSSGPAHTPHLAVGFTSVDVAGQSYAVQSTVTTLPTVQSRRTARAAQAAEVGGGAVAGGLLGRLIGGRKSGGTVIGAVAGAAAGVVVADKTESHDAVLPKGARVTLRLTNVVTIPRA